MSTDTICNQPPPPVAPEKYIGVLEWSGKSPLTSIGNKVKYQCLNGRKLKHGFDITHVEVECLAENTYSVLDPTTECVSSKPRRGFTEETKIIKTGLCLSASFCPSLPAHPGLPTGSTWAGTATLTRPGIAYHGECLSQNKDTISTPSPTCPGVTVLTRVHREIAPGHYKVRVDLHERGLVSS